MKQSLVELRGLAQSMGVKWAFSDDFNALRQKISLRQADMLPPPIMPIVPIPDDQRLRDVPPSTVSDEDTIRTIIEPYIARGMQAKFECNHFYFRYKERSDTGTMRQPLRVVVGCAARLFE